MKREGGRRRWGEGEDGMRGGELRGYEGGSIRPPIYFREIDAIA
jgi:hypothetical protein